MPNSIQHSAAMFFLRLAWRNLWRNRKRTLIAAASVFFAVFLAVLMSSMTSGQHEYMIHSAVSMYTGHMQVHGRGYWENRSLDRSMPLDPALLRAARALPGVACATPRFETGALISHGLQTKVSPVIGIDAANEHALTGLGKRVVRGTPYAAWKSGAIVAEGLARLLKAGVGDSIVVYGQGYQGVTAARVVRIASIARFPIPDLDNAMLYLPLAEAQELFAAPGRATAIALLLRDGADEAEVASAMRGHIAADMEVLTWRDMMPELLQAIAADTGGTVIMLLILYVVIGFGIFGTVMMMTAERSREFGITIAVGMQRGRLIAVTVLESIIVSMLGALAGIAASIPVLVYFTRHPIVFGGDYAKAMLAYGMEPILPLSLEPMVFAWQGVIVFALGALSALYPVFVLHRLEPVRAMRG